ncbi:Fatty acid synthase subunit beta [Fusarium oxysporum f. sp. conglutinans]|nr:Fatty acid synthase subunit beta [Fusarium oxysporum f. sp. conglutinans]
MQYVCAGDLRALDTLAGVANFIKVQKIAIEEVKDNIEEVKGHLREIIRGCAEKTLAKPTPLELERGFATIPLRGIDKINKTSIDPSKLVGKYIPNVTAKPFALTKEYFEDVYKLTNSPKIGAILANWDKYNQDEAATNGVESSDSSSGEYKASGRAA